MDVEYHVAVVGDDSFAPNGLAPELHEVTSHVGTRHRHDLDRQRELAQYVNELAVVDDADELPGCRRDDLFPGEGGPAPLDEHAARRRLVGAVDIQGKIAFGIQVQLRNPRLGQALRSLTRTRNSAF